LIDVCIIGEGFSEQLSWESRFYADT